MPGLSGFFRKAGFILLFSLLSVLLFSGRVHSRAGEGWLMEEGGKEGFYWYKDEVKAEKKVRKEKKEKKPRRYSLKELVDMDVKALRKELRRALDMAVSNPTEENMIYYLTVQDAVRKKALAFVNVFEFVLQKYPEYSLALYNYPVPVPGLRAMRKVVQEEISGVLERERENFGLLFFTSRGCPYCSVQRSIVDMFRVKWGWKVKELDVDDYRDLANKLNIPAVPYMVVVSKETRKYMPVGVGVITLTEMERRIVRAIRYLKGEVTPQDFLRYEYEKTLREMPIIQETKNQPLQ